MCIICSGNYDNNIKILNIDDCQYIKEIPLFENLTHLSCINTNITSMPNFPNLTHLACNTSNFKKVPSLPKLIYFFPV